MKSLITAIAVVAAFSAVSPAEAQQPAATQPAQQQPAPAYNPHRVGLLIGELNGEQARQVSGERKQNDNEAYRNQFLEGVRAALLADTAHTAYIDGLSVGMTMLKGIIDMGQKDCPVDRDELYKGYVETFMGKGLDRQEYLKIQEELDAILGPRVQAYRARMEEAQKLEQERRQKLAGDNLLAGRVFIDSLKKADKSIQTTESGLSYKVIKKGKGPNVTPDDQADVIYNGKFIDGREFDSSKGQPVSFTTNGLIRGFSEGLQLMNKGAKYILYIPSDLAYGANAPDAIGPNQTLVFEVEVKDIQTPKAE